MQILSKKKFEFRDGTEKFTTAGGGVIETAPDWIARTPFFKAIVNDGNILEIATRIAVPVSKGEDKKPEEPKISVTPVPSADDIVAVATETGTTKPAKK